MDRTVWGSFACLRECASRVRGDRRRPRSGDLFAPTHLQPTRPGAKHPPLAYRIAAHLVVDHYRKQAIRAQEILASELSCPLAGPPPGPEEIQLQRERAESIEASLLELPECCRRAFVLYAREGLSYAQIASRLGVSKSMVAKHLARAILHCKRRLGE